MQITVVCNRYSDLISLSHLLRLDRSSFGYDGDFEQYSLVAIYLEPAMINTEKPNIFSDIDALSPKIDIQPETVRQKALLANLKISDTVINIPSENVESKGNLAILLEEARFHGNLLEFSDETWDFDDDVSKFIENCSSADYSQQLKTVVEKKLCGYWSSFISGLATAYLRSGQLIQLDNSSHLHVSSTAPVGAVARKLSSMDIGGIKNQGKAIATFSVFEIIDGETQAEQRKIISLARRLQKKGALLNLLGANKPRLPESVINRLASVQSRFLGIDKQAWIASYSSADRFGILANEEFDFSSLKNDELWLLDKIKKKSATALTQSSTLSKVAYSISDTGGGLSFARANSVLELLYHGWIYTANDKVLISEDFERCQEKTPAVGFFDESGESQAMLFKESARMSSQWLKANVGELDPEASASYLEKAPATKSLSYMRSIESKLGVYAPYEAFCTKEDCEKFINTHKKGLPTKRPSNAMLAMVDWLESKHGIEPSEGVKLDFYRCRKHIAKHKPKVR